MTMYQLPVRAVYPVAWAAVYSTAYTECGSTCVNSSVCDCI